MMHFQLAGSGVMSAFYPHESELSRRVKQLIRAAKKQLEALCAMTCLKPKLSTGEQDGYIVTIVNSKISS